MGIEGIEVKDGYFQYMNKSIGFLGPKGTFSHEAVEGYRSRQNKAYEIKEYHSIKDVLCALKDGEVDEAIVPIENSLEGAVNVTLDVLAKEEDMFIVDEFIIPVNLNLVAKQGTKAEDIKVLMSHPQPLGQCRNYLNTNFPGVVQLEENSTSKAAQKVVDGDGTCAAITSKIAAKIYGLEVLETNIQDNENNHTRFVIIARSLKAKTGADKTSIVFSTDNKPGSLYRVLDIFSLWDINMTRIESRPSKSALGQYIFFVDIDGHIEDPDVHDALTMVKRKTSFYKFLGSYPAFAGKI